MIKHVVMWRVSGKTVADRKSGSTRVAAAFQTLRGRIAGLKHLEVGVGTVEGEDMCDVVLITEFESAAALDAYAVHPLHLAVREELAGVRISRHCIDFEVQHG